MPVDQNDRGFQHFKQHLQNIGGFGDPKHLRQGILGVVDEGGEAGPTYYSDPNVSGDAFAGGVYDDFVADYVQHPYAHPEHPEFRDWWKGNLDGIVDRKERADPAPDAKPTDPTSAPASAPAPEPEPVFSSSQAGFSSSTPVVTALRQQSGFVPTPTTDPSAPEPEPLQSFVTQLREDLGTDPEAQAL